MADLGFYFYLEYEDKLSRLSDEQLGLLVRQLLCYKRTGEVSSCGDPLVDLSFDFIRVDIDKQTERYKAKAEAGHKGGSKPKQTEANGSKTKQTEADESKPKQTEANGSQKRKEKEKEKKKEESIANAIPKKAGAFVPPTLEEVQEYCASRGSPVDPRQFWEYFDTGHWIDSRGQPVRNWKQKLITWERVGHGKHDSKHGFEQHGYTNEELENLLCN